MVGTLLVRGMLVGVVAALLSFGFLKLVGEPAVDRAIAFETTMDESKDKAKMDGATASGLPAPVNDYGLELVSRPVQAGIGLFTGVTVYNTAFGGLFALVYALTFGRMGDFGPRATSALLALSGIVAIYILPNLKYPANPPSVGDPETIGARTALYFAMIAFSLAAMIGAWMVRNRLLARYGVWNAAIIAAIGYLVVVVAVVLLMPTVNEVPEGFPATVLWQFRTASIGAQIIMWATIGLGFGAWVDRSSPSRRGKSLNPEA
jgi:Probable cobalt transporter subunit (CbtA)